MDKVSVIIPVYNVRPYLDECVNSVISQSYEDLEIIVVDDGSTDGSADICDRLAAQDKRITLVHKKNGGLSSARNAGLDIASGDYVFFLDSDDFIVRECIEMLVKTAKDEKADVVLFNYFRTRDAQGSSSRAVTEIPQEQCLINITMLGNYIITPTKLYSAQIFADLRFPHGKLHEDEFICHEVFAKSKKTVYLDDKLYFYRLNENGITHTRPTMKNLDSFEAVQRRLEFLERNGYRQAFIANQMRLFAVFCLYVPALKAENAEDRARINKMKAEIKELLPQLKKNRYITQTGYKLTIKCMLISIDLALLLTKAKRMIFNRKK